MCASSSYESKTNTVVFDELLIWVYLSREISIHGLRFFMYVEEFSPLFESIVGWDEVQNKDYKWVVVNTNTLEPKPAEHS